MRTIVPRDGMVITESVRLEPGLYILPSGISIGSDGVQIDGTGVTFVGEDERGTGIRIEDRTGIEVRGLKLLGYRYGFFVKNSREVTIAKNAVALTQEIAPNTVFLDIWLGPEDAYGAGIMLHEVADAMIEDNLLQHQMNGLLSYYCKRLRVSRNTANYCSGYGFHLYGTCDSVFEDNFADFCCRFEPREGPKFFGHMGADATGFLIVYGSCRNVFRGNSARLGGDGFFLAGLSASGEAVGCDDNLFENNDASLSPNIAFEATFSSGNQFIGNRADRGNFGFWLGYCTDTLVERNRMVMNRQAGIAAENAHDMVVQGNEFQGNGHGVLLWSGSPKSFARTHPAHETSFHWTIRENTFTRNGKAIRIAADQDHGIRPGKGDALEPRAHRIESNDIQDNRVGIELYRCKATTILSNILNRNVEANLRTEDSAEIEFKANLGAAGAYL